MTLSVDDEGRSTPVPPLHPTTPEGERRFRQGAQRRELRAEMSQRLDAMKAQD